MPSKYDQDFRFGSEGIRDAFYLVKLLEDAQWPGMRHFDAHAYRTEDDAGVWDFARGCIRTYLILREKAQRFHADDEIQAALETAMVDRLAEPALAAVTPDAIAQMRRGPHDLERDGDARLRPRATRPARDRAAARHALRFRRARAAGSRRRLVDAVDQGRSSRRRHRRARGVGRAPHPPTTPPRSEQDPEAWWEALQHAVEQAGPAARDVAAMSVAGQQHGLVVLDADDRVVRPAKLWNDTESAPDARWLIDQLAVDGVGGEDAWAAACGSVPVAAFTITKLSWLHRSEPDAWARVARVCLPHDWLTWKLSGEFVTDRGDASGTGYFSAAADEYRLDLLAIVDRHLDWPERLPRVLAPTERAGTTTALGSNAVVAPGTGDNMAAALALGLRAGRRRDLARYVGHGLHGERVADGRCDRRGRRASPTRPAAILPLVCTLNATKVTDTVAEWLGVDHAGLDALALPAPAGANGVVVVPYFDGERTPNRPDATGHDRRAANVDDARRPRARGDRRRGVRPARRTRRVDARPASRADGGITLVGGGARSAAYQRVLADLSGRPVLVPDAGEHVAAGACVQAAAALHGVDAGRRSPASGTWRAARRWSRTDVDRARSRRDARARLSSAVAQAPAAETEARPTALAVRTRRRSRPVDATTVEACPPPSSSRWNSPIRFSISSATRRSCGCVD